MWQTTKPDTRFLGRQYYKCHECRSFKDTKIDIMWRNLGPESLKHILHEIYLVYTKKIDMASWLWRVSERMVVVVCLCGCSFFFIEEKASNDNRKKTRKAAMLWWWSDVSCTRLKAVTVQKVVCTRLQKQPPVQRDSCAGLQTASRTNCHMYSASNSLQYRKCDVHSAFGQMYAAPKSLPYKCLLYTAAKSASRTEKSLYTASNSLLYMNSKKNTNIGM